MIRLFLISAVSSLAACLPVAADRIYAEDLARANPSFATAEARREIGPAPLAGVRRLFSAGEIAALAKRFGIVLTTPASEICLERLAESLSPERLLPVLSQALAMDSARIELLDFSRYLVVPGTLEFPRANLSANGFWRGRVVFTQGRSTPVWARVKIFDKTTGDPLPLTEPRPARADSGPREIERGDTVRVEVQSGRVLLAFDASAETSGRAGETILIRNRDNGRRFQATVKEKGKVVIHK